jgi:hypothetical protein
VFDINIFMSVSLSFFAKKSSIMKSKLLTAVFIMGCMAANAQFGTQGQRILGGGFSIAHSDSKIPNGDKVQNTNIDVSFTSGVFKKPNVLVTYSLYFGIVESKNKPNPNAGLNVGGNVGGVGYGRTWFQPLGKKFFWGLGLQADARMSYLRQKNVTIPPQIDRSYSINVGLVPQVSYQASERFVFNLRTSNSFASLGYSYAKSEANGIDGRITQTVNVNTGFWSSPFQNIQVGFSYLLKPKKK